MAQAAPHRSTAQLWVDMLAARSRSGGRGRTLGGRIRPVQNREFYDGDLVPGTRYRVTSLMGSGGMGTVYEVEHVELGRRFVLKALLRELARRQDLVQRLRNEWRALGRLEHPNIVNVTDAGTTPTGVPYYVMERLEGETLAARLRRVRRLTAPEAVEIASGILEGLSAAHEIGVIHRDVKPPNVFLLSGDRPKVLDFGVAKINDAANVVTARGMAVGTPRYMSPEQARGVHVDGRSDIYAVGLLLFEMIAGVGPFDDARDANEMLVAHMAREAPRLGSVAMGVLPALDEILSMMLAKDARQRPSSARELAAALRVIAGGYSEGVSTTDATPAAGYTATTVELVMEALTRELTTRPDGYITGAVTQSNATHTTVDPTPSWQLTDAPSSGALPTVARRASLPLPPEAYVQSDVEVSAMPATTSVDPMPAAFTGQPGGMALSTHRANGPWISTERLSHDSEAQETRTRVPAAEPPTLATPIPVVPSGNMLPPNRRGLIGVVALGLLAAGMLAWLVIKLATTGPASSAPLPAPAAIGSAVTAGSAASPRASSSSASPAARTEPARAQPTASAQQARPTAAKTRPARAASASIPEGERPQTRPPAPLPEKTAKKPPDPPAAPRGLLPASGL